MDTWGSIFQQQEALSREAAVAVPRLSFPVLGDSTPGSQLHTPFSITEVLQLTEPTLFQGI